MSLGLLLGDLDTVRVGTTAGLLAVQTLRDVRWGALDWLLLDLPPGTGEPQASLLAADALDGAVVVTTPQEFAVLDAGRALGLFRDAGAPVLGVVENMSYQVCPHCGERIEVFRRGGRTLTDGEGALPILGRVPLSPELSGVIAADYPLARSGAGSAEATVFIGIAERLRARCL